jgi:hypothetical protein
MFPTWSDWDIKYTRKGLVKLAATRALKLLAVFATVAAIIRLRTNGQGIGHITVLMRNYVRRAILSGSVILQLAGNKI